MAQQQLFADPASEFDLINQKAQERKRQARQLIDKSINTDGEMVSGFYVPKNPWQNFVEGAAGGYYQSSADTDVATALANRLKQQDEWNQRFANAKDTPTSPQFGPTEDGGTLPDIPNGPTKRELLSEARNKGLRYDLEQAFMKDDADKDFRAEQATAARIDKAHEAEANRAARSEDLAAKLKADAEAKKQHDEVLKEIAKNRGSGGSGGGKAPSGYEWVVDDKGVRSLQPIKGGPADPNNAKANAPKPLTSKQLETQRGFMDLESSLSNYEQMINNYDFQGKTAVSPAQRAALEGAYTDVQMKLKTLYELGAPQAGDLKILAQSIPNPTDLHGTLRGVAFGAEPFKAKLAETRKLLRNSQANFEKQLGKATPEAAKPAQPKKVGNVTVERLD